MKKIIYPVFSLILLIVLGSCVDDPSVNATRLRIHLTDAPISASSDKSVIIHEFHVDIDKIEVSATDSLGGNEEWITLDYKGGRYDLLPLTNGKLKEIYDAYFPAGNLLRMKVYYGDNSILIVNKDKKEHQVHLDPACQDGVEYEVNTALYPHYVSNIIIDINASLSLYEEGGNFYFKPEARVFSATYGGTLKGRAGPMEALPAVFAFNETDTLLTFPEPADGTFQLLGLNEGVWDIYIFSRLGAIYTDTLFADTIYTGKDTTLTPITLKLIQEPEEPDPEYPDTNEPDPDEEE